MNLVAHIVTYDMLKLHFFDLFWIRVQQVHDKLK